MRWWGRGWGSGKPTCSSCLTPYRVRWPFRSVPLAGRIRAGGAHIEARGRRALRGGARRGLGRGGPRLALSVGPGARRHVRRGAADRARAAPHRPLPLRGEAPSARRGRALPRRSRGPAAAAGGIRDARRQPRPHEVRSGLRGGRARRRRAREARPRGPPARHLRAGGRPAVRTCGGAARSVRARFPLALPRRAGRGDPGALRPRGPRLRPRAAHRDRTRHAGAAAAAPPALRRP